jgi:hypothetical protein
MDVIENLSISALDARRVMPGVMPLFVMNTYAALFEVMDKEPSLLQIWSSALIIGVGGFFLCRYRPWALAVVLPIVLFLSTGHLLELHDPFVGKHILREAGRTYFVQSYIAMAIQVVLPCLSLVVRRKRLP